MVAQYIVAASNNGTRYEDNVKKLTKTRYYYVVPLRHHVSG